MENFHTKASTIASPASSDPVHMPPPRLFPRRSSVAECKVVHNILMSTELEDPEKESQDVCGWA